jgi:hypothetical protein
MIEMGKYKQAIQHIFFVYETRTAEPRTWASILNLVCPVTVVERNQDSLQIVG